MSISSFIKGKHWQRHSGVLAIIELVMIIAILFHNHTSSILHQREMDEKFMMYLSSSNDALYQVSAAKEVNLDENALYAASSELSSAYGILNYTTYCKKYPELSNALLNLKNSFINVPMKILLEKSDSLAADMDNMLKDKWNKNYANTFNTYLINLQYSYHKNPNKKDIQGN